MASRTEHEALGSLVNEVLQAGPLPANNAFRGNRRCEIPDGGRAAKAARAPHRGGVETEIVTQFDSWADGIWEPAKHRYINDGRLNPQFRAMMEHLSQRNGWFVPVGTLLNFLQEQKGPITITPQERRWLERRWSIHKIRFGSA
jgi:hypothetical protein